MTAAVATEGQGEPDWPTLLEAACRGVGVSSVYQPIVDLARGVAVGYEGLTRFPVGQGGGPDRWFAAARACGRHAELEAVALRCALRAREQLPQNTFLTVNVSPDLLGSAEVRAVWRDEGDLGGLVVELTEQAPIESYSALEGDLASLRAAGAMIAVDDAGAGYAGLRHLLSLRPSIIKLDRELVCDVDRDEAKRALVEMVGLFAGRIDAWLLAEGIERAGELDALTALGVPLAQGYFLARPGPVWPGVSPDAVLRLVTRGTASTERVTVRDLMEVAPTVTNAARTAPHGGHPVVLVDDHARPLALLHGEPGRPGEPERSMCVNLDTPVAEALLRAVTRRLPQRYDPVMCTDSAGRYLGIVRIERMIHAAVGRTAHAP